MKKKPLVEVASFSFSLLPSDLMAKTVHFSDISLNAPKIYVERSRSGELNLLQAFVPEKSAAGDEPDQAPGKAPPGEAASPPVVDIDAMAVHEGMVLFTDQLPAAVEGSEAAGPESVKVLVDKITLQGESLSTRENIKGSLKLSLNFNRTGFLRTSGALGLNPLDLDTSVDIGNVALAALQPYVAQKADLLLADGRFSLKGTARVRAGEAGLTAAFRGSTSLNRLDVRDSRTSDALLAWKQLRVDGIEAGFNPLMLKIKTIDLTDLFAGIVVEDDGLLNVQKITKKAGNTDANPAPEQAKPSVSQAPPEAAADGPATSPNITIGQVLLSNGRISFIDKHVKPKYTASLDGIEGKASGLSSKEDLTADLLLHASFDQYAPLAVAGKINPLRKELFLDVKTDFKDLELSTLTPYSGTYIGRAVEKGKLSFSLQYHITQKKLDAKNEVFIDQLTLGEKIESPKATSLPVGLAIALLKNRKGEIKLDIPVTGEIDKPEFSVGKIILQVLVNLLVKAATSPFALLGSMMGGEDLGYVEFEHGSAAVTGDNAKKIGALVNSLYDRQELKLEITGFVDLVKDSEALRSARMKALLVAEKVKDLPPISDQPVSPETVEISAQNTRSIQEGIQERKIFQTEKSVRHCEGHPRRRDGEAAPGKHPGKR